MTQEKNDNMLQALVKSLTAAGTDTYNKGVTVAPAAILWTDERREWEPLLPLLFDHLPTLAQLGPYKPEIRSGPAIWLRCLVARELEAKNWPQDAIPIFYLPGVSRQSLRAVDTCPAHLQPLAELQYRGVFWSHQNARDWTINAFLITKDSLNLAVAQDGSTQEALQRALLTLAEIPIDSLRGRLLEASDFDELLSPDPTRDLLCWMSAPDDAQKSWPNAKWEAFRSICQAKYSFDPQTDGVLVAAERMDNQNEAWKQLWLRFTEAPRNYPGIPALLEQAHPRLLIDDHSVWPRSNQNDENTLRDALNTLASMSRKDAVEHILKLEQHHAPRRDWVWSKLGQAPLANALQHLEVLAKTCTNSLGSSTPEAMAQHYQQDAWRADDAALQALAAVSSTPDQDAVKTALKAIYEPWLADAAVHLQNLVAQHGYPGASEDARTPTTAQPGECLLFGDGIRYDIGQRLQNHLQNHGFNVQQTTRWSAIPSVTATCKLAVSPISDLIIGDDVGTNFLPNEKATQKPLITERFRKLLEQAGYQVLLKNDLGQPDSQSQHQAWTEHGEIDQYGHDLNWKLAYRIDDQIYSLAERIEALLFAGWKSVKVITDHGWLLLPGGLPKVEIPQYLTDTRWSRSATLKSTTQDNDFLTMPWHWSDSVRIALAPGIGAFKAGIEYTHGGLSLQECLTPILTVTRGDALQESAIINDATWRGMRCRVHVSDMPPDSKVDIRTKAADEKTSLALSPKAIELDGTASLVIPDDDHLGTAAYIVVINASDTVVAQIQTCIGGQ